MRTHLNIRFSQCAIILMLGVISVLCLASCHKDNPVQPPSNGAPVFSGTVRDSAGAPVAGAGVHFITFFDRPPGSYAAAKTNVSVRITYVVDSVAQVLMILYRHGTDQIMDTVVNAEQGPGYYSVQLDDITLTNGLYYAKLFENGRLVWSHDIMLLITDLGQFPHLHPVAYTDAQGKFTLPLAVFGAGVRLLQSAGSPDVIDTITITTSIDLVLCKPGYQSLSQYVQIDTVHGNSESFVMMH